MQSLSEVAVIDRQKYIKELTKLLSGMAPADREAVLRGVSARFAERGDDDAVIRELGSPTFAAVQVLRGYTPPDPEEHPEAYIVEQPAPEAETPPEAEAAAEPPEQGPAPGPEAVPQPETAPAREEEPVPEQTEADTAEENAAEESAAGEGPEPEGETPPEEPDAAGESGEAAPPEEEPAAEPAPAEDGAPEDFPDIEAILEEAEEAAAASELPPPEPEGAEAGAAPEQPPEGLGVPVWGPPRPRAKPALLALYVLGAVVLGLPVTVLITAAALAVLLLAGGVLYAGGLAISFCFLGLTVVADILMCAGAGLVLVGMGLPLACLAVWIFVRGAVGFVNLLIRKGGDWCYDHGEVTGQ